MFCCSLDKGDFTGDRCQRKDSYHVEGDQDSCASAKHLFTGSRCCDWSYWHWTWTAQVQRRKPVSQHGTASLSLHRYATISSPPEWSKQQETCRLQVGKLDWVVILSHIQCNVPPHALCAFYSNLVLFPWPTLIWPTFLLAPWQRKRCLTRAPM